MDGHFKTLLEMRDRNQSRLIDYDLKVLTLLIGLATAWGVIDGLGLKNEFKKEILEVILAASGLVVSLAWSARRNFLFRIDDAIVAELPRHVQAVVRSPTIRTAQEAFKRRGILALPEFVTVFSLRHGHILAILLFIGLVMWAVRTVWESSACNP